MNSIRGVLAILFLSVNTAFWCVPLYIMGLVRWLLPVASVQKWISGAMDVVIHGWVGCNRVMNAVLALHRNELSIHISQPLSTRAKYIVVCNHQSWSDIFVLQNTLRGVIGPLKFFTKSQLIWLPLLGVAMWFLGFPYVRRRGDDSATLAKSCEGFKQHPVAVLNFLEGTRFTSEKHQRFESPYNHLLPPKTGGLAHVLGQLGAQVDQILDVTISYPDGTPSFWQFLKGETGRVLINIKGHPVPIQGQDRSLTNPEIATLRSWTDTLWQAKDAALAKQLHTTAAAPIKD